MFRSSRIPLIIVIVLFAGLVVAQHFSPKPVDWRVNCNIYSKSPYGCFVLSDLFNTLFPGQAIGYNDECFAVSLDTNAVARNVVVITPSFRPDKYDVKALLAFVSKGNQLFISSTSFSEPFLDTLGIKFKGMAVDTSIFKPGAEELYLKNLPQGFDSIYRFNRKMALFSFTAFDPSRVSVLGNNRQHQPNFIKIPTGRGEIYLHLQPLAFTNYHLLYGNTDYASAVLSYLPVQKTDWDNYYNPDHLVNSSPTRYILSQPALRAAYYLLLLSLLLYMVVESKRRQRIVPVIKAPENWSLEYVKTIGGLYFSQHDNADLARKKITYFKEFLRGHYYISHLSNTPESIAQVSAKTGVDPKLIARLMEKMQYYETAGHVHDDSLVEFHRQLEQFYEQCL